MKPKGRWLTLIMILGACSGSPATTTTLVSSADPVATSTTSTSTPGSPSTPVSSTTTIEPTTTTTIPAVSDTFLIAGNTCLLGWWDGDWQSEGSAPVVGGEDYQVVKLTEEITTAVGTEPRPWCEPLELLNIEFDPALPGEWQDLDAVAIQTDGDVRPHKVELVSTSTVAYIDATADLLAGRVVGVPIINLTQVVRTDLEGDGVDEVIVAASTMPDDPLDTAAGDYTIVYLRKVLDGEVET